MQNRILVNNFQ